MKIKKSIGLDGLSNEIRKLFSPIIEPYLVDAIHKAIETQCFPESLKMAKVIALFKKGDASLPETFCLISLLSSMSKVFRNLFYKKMTKSLNKNKHFAENQFSFRKQFSCLYEIAQKSKFLHESYNLRSEGCGGLIDMKKHLIQLTIQFFCQSWKPVVFVDLCCT